MSPKLRRGQDVGVGDGAPLGVGSCFYLAAGKRSLEGQRVRNVGGLRKTKAINIRDGSGIKSSESQAYVRRRRRVLLFDAKALQLSREVDGLQMQLQTATFNIQTFSPPPPPPPYIIPGLQ